MNNKYRNAIKSIQNEIKKLDSDKAELYTNFIDNEMSHYTENSFVYSTPKLRELIIDVDPLNRDEKYILSNLIKHENSARNFYRYLYNNHYLGSEYRFIKNMTTYGFVKKLYENGLSVKNVCCCAKGPKGQSLFIVDTQNRDVILMIEDYFDNLKYVNFDHLFVNYITTFLDNHNVTNYDDINDELIEKCIIEAPKYKVACNCRSFFAYSILKATHWDHFKLYPISILSRSTLTKELLDGYRTVYYNHMDNIPEYDKWLLLPNGEEKRVTTLTAESVISMNFTKVHNKYFRKLLKEWFWCSTASIKTSAREMPIIANFLNMFFPDEPNFDVASTLNNENPLNITQAICANYKSFVQSKWSKTETRSGRIYPILSFVRFIDNYVSSIHVDKECYLYLTCRGSLNQNGPVGVKKEHLEQIASYINNHKYDNHNSFCFYVMFHIALNTEFRISQIVSLPANCVKESMKKNEYVIRTNMKQSGYESIDQPCARIVKDIIYAYQKATEDYHADLPLSLRKYLFIHENITGKIQAPFNANQFTTYLKSVCEKLGLPSYTAKNLRITYITNAKAYAQRNGLSDLTLLRVTNHANMDTVNNHYIQEQIIDALQATIGVVIGDVNIDGTISANSDGFNTSEDVSVANGLGFCQSMQCTNQGPLPCQRCKHFFTTLQNIPYYREEIKRLQAINDGSLNPHDAEDINNLIRMNTYILGELINLKKMKGDKKDGIIC